MNHLLQLHTEHLDASKIAARKDDCLILPLYDKPKDDPLLHQIDPSGELAKALERQGAGGTLHIPVTSDAVAATQLLLVWPKFSSKTPKERTWMKTMQSAMAQLASLKAGKAAIVLRSPNIEGIDLAWTAEQVARMAEVVCYNYRIHADLSKSGQKAEKAKKDKNKGDKASKLKELTLLGDTSTPLDVLQNSVRRGAAVGLGINSTRRLGDLPPNVCNPTFLAQLARNMADEHDCLELTLLDEKDLEKEGMHSLLSVAKGSRQPAFLLRLRYRNGGDNSATCALIGKGVTFDTGGISLKPSGGMADMKYDMSGAGSVLGVMSALADLKPPINVDGIVATVENMPDGQATRPGDVVASLSGKTIEILNTDAEGRLILCDALTWAAREKPDYMIDIATLTGACVVALGHEASAMYSNDDSLADKLQQAAQTSSDRIWRMPLWSEYDDLLKSRYADVPNISSGPGAGSITAACFLQRFVGKTSWAHLDIAGTAYKGGGAQKAATGRPVGLLLQFLLAGL